MFPNCCIHFEDWTGVDAIALLARYRDKVSCYNDDIQGTAGVTLAGLINALKITGGQLKDQRILFLGAGSAAIGLANLIVSALGQQGIAPEDARQQIRMFDITRTGGCGAAGPCRTQAALCTQVAAQQTLQPSRSGDRAATDSSAAIEDFKPTTLIGVEHRGQAVLAESRRGYVAPQRAARSSLPFPTRPRSTNACPRTRIPGRRARRSTPAVCNSLRFTLTERRFCHPRPTTCISFRPLAWPFTPPRRSE